MHARSESASGTTPRASFGYVAFATTEPVHCDKRGPVLVQRVAKGMQEVSNG